MGIELTAGPETAGFELSVVLGNTVASAGVVAVLDFLIAEGLEGSECYS